MPLLFQSAIVRRADFSDGVAALEVRAPGETAVILVGVTRVLRGVGVASSDARRAEWGARLPFARSGIGKSLEGGRIAGLFSRGVRVDKDDVRRTVQIEGNRVVVREESPSDEADDESERPAYESRGRELLRALAEEARERRRELVLRALARGQARIERRVAAMRSDLARLADAESLAAQAQWLIAEAARAPRGARSLKVTDWSTGEARVLDVPLDPAKPARVQIDAMFQRARRLKRGAKIAEERIAKAKTILAGLAGAIETARSATRLEDLDAAIALARSVAPKDISFDSTNAPSVGKQAKSAAFRTFSSASGARIFVGKGAAQNDRLTFQTARPHDLWLHAKGHTGAHVIVPLAKNTTCAAELLVDAAHLAAHFSEARGEAVVEIQYTPRKYLRKPRGSAPGRVVVDREKVLAVRIEPGRLERLLEAEEQ